MFIVFIGCGVLVFVRLVGLVILFIVDVYLLYVLCLR